MQYNEVEIYHSFGRKICTRALLYNEYEGSTFLRNNDKFLSDYTPSHPRRQDGQCTYSVTLSRVGASIVIAENNMHYIFGLCVCNLRHPARNTHAQYYHLPPVRIYEIFHIAS
jgi:hypothetical protein